MSDSMENYRIALSDMSSGLFLFSIFMLSITVPLNIASADNHEDVTYTLSGHIYTADGQLANTTSIKVDSMASVWSQNGYCLLYTSPSPRDDGVSRMPSSA